MTCMIMSTVGVVTGVCLVLVLSLLLGQALTPSVLTAVLAAFTFLELFSIAVKACKDSGLQFNSYV